MVDPKIFEECIHSAQIESASVPSSTYVLKNGCPSAYRGLLENYPAKVLTSNENTYFPRGANKVIRAGTSTLVMFVTDDIILHDGTLEKLVRRMDDPTIGLCGLKLIFPEDSSDPGRPAGKVQHIGHGVDIRGEIVHPLIGWSPEHPKCNVSRDVASVTGGAFIVRRKVFNQVGGFFEGYGVGYWEDVDLCFGVRELGYRVFIDTEATATHYVGSSYSKSKIKVPIEQNKAILRQRKGKLFVHDSWTFWILSGIIWASYAMQVL